MKEQFPGCFSLLNDKEWPLFSEIAEKQVEVSQLLGQVQNECDRGALPAALVDLLRLEIAVSRVQEQHVDFPANPDRLHVNPTLEMLMVSWSGLVDQLNGGEHAPNPCDAGYVLIWRRQNSAEIMIRQASSATLLALKVVLEDSDSLLLAKDAGVPVQRIDAAIDLAVDDGILLRPATRIRRVGSPFADKGAPEKFMAAEVFTLQWHLTQACDLHCKHCYDRSSIVDMPLAQGVAILDDFRKFCLAHFVDGQVSFTGGNPFLYPHFMTLYQAAVDRNLGVAILGNPVEAGKIDALLAIKKPSFYQVSLEGMVEHNDWIRGTGHFQRILSFLDILRSRSVYSMVMLTLTRENQGQVLELAETLEGRADLFTFNRLSMVGEGANLQGADIEGYRAFLDTYGEAAKANPVMAFKDNLLNIIRHEEGTPVFGGCAGFGCGAAFNFVAVLPNGEVHACRKYPSPIGNITENTLDEIYDSEIAKRYRHGSKACEDCKIRPNCGGCPAVVFGLGKDPFNDLDPYCFMKTEPE